MILRLILVFSAIAAQNSTLVDLTGVVVRNRIREPRSAAASSGLVGYSDSTTEKKPLSLTLSIINIEDSVLTYEIGIRNLGEQVLLIPVDANSLDVEPQNSKEAYSFTQLHISLSSNEGATGGSLS